MNHLEIVNNLKTKLCEIYGIELKTKADDPDAKRRLIIRKIEEVVGGILNNIAQGHISSLESINHSNWKNCEFNETLTTRKDQIKKKIITLQKPKGRLKFAMITFLFSKIHKLLTIAKSCTRRELYYRNLQIFRSQREVDDNMRDVSYILNFPPWDLGVLATSKGLVFGALVLCFQNGEFLDCNIKGGAGIPSNVCNVVNLTSSAEFVLIVEKDASFHNLLKMDVCERLGKSIIITGKGFPDVGTRILVCKFWEILRIPIFILTDSDPYGFEIMCIYRFGSVSMSSHSNYLTCPAVRWLGVHPSDIKPLLLDSKSLSEMDKRKIHSMMKRSYVKDNEQLKYQLELQLKENVKAEIEALSSVSPNYLIEVYLKSKIQSQEYY